MAKSTDTGLAAGGSLGAEAKKKLVTLKDRILEVLSQRDTLNEDVKEIFKEAKDAGFDTKILRKAVKLLRTDPADQQAEADMIDSYVEAMGGLPLFEAAKKRAA